mgnify:CR=1 FL=1
MKDLPNLAFERIPKNATILSMPNYYIAVVNDVRHLVIMEGNKQLFQQRELDRRAKQGIRKARQLLQKL